MGINARIGKIRSTEILGNAKQSELVKDWKGESPVSDASLLLLVTM